MEWCWSCGLPLAVCAACCGSMLSLSAGAWVWETYGRPWKKSKRKTWGPS